MTAMRVAMLSVHTCPLAALGGKETGGMNVYVRELSRELGRMGVDVDVFTRSQNPAIPRTVELGPRAQVVHLPAGPEAPMPKERVHDHLEEFIDGVDAWRVAEGIEYDLIHGHYWLSGTVALALRERWGVPAVQMFHTLGRLKNDVARSAREIEPAVRLGEEARIVERTDRLIAANVVERASLVERYGASAARIATIPCGVDTDLFRPGDASEARIGLGLDDGWIILYVGRLAPIKGLETLLDAMPRLMAGARRPQLLIVGGETDEPLDGHERALRQRIADLRLGEAVRFVGARPQSLLREYYVAADVTVLPSWYESFGMVALEAMACGTPIIASRVGGLTTTVRDGITGFLVPDGDPVTLAERIAAVLAQPATRTTMGAAGVRWASQHRWPCVAEAVCREYARLQARAGLHLPATRCHVAL